ncbi:DUF4190 domain-containing protein [Kitasatospora sp. NPDC059146]|uniref:DUF4190 domain-containing protein n=1 Tax=Kitasatospora sp. NPDC059146 TaxID=3346741 RepID=UPI0036ADEE35
MHTREDEPRTDVRTLDRQAPGHDPAPGQGPTPGPHHDPGPGPGPGPHHGVRPPARRNGPAVAALTLGVLGAVTSIVVVGGLFGVLGLVLGAVALRTARRTGTGRGMANAGVVLSLLAIAGSVLAAVLLAWYADRTQPCYRPDSFRQYRECVQQQFHRG